MYKCFETKDDFYKYLEENNLEGLDSEYSLSTKKLKEKFNVKDVHFNKWWVMTPVHWKCPSCCRSKEQIVRLNKHGHLSGQLHEHHDHMKDLVKNRFQVLSSSKMKIVADNLAEKFAIRLSFAFAAYDNTIICSDCNSADKEAKKIVNAHDYFSFAPSDIRIFLIIENNEEHKINVQKAKKIWEEQKEIFKIRMDFLNKIADLAAENMHWYKPSETTVKQIENIANRYMELYGLKNLQKFDTETLLYKTQKYNGNLSDWRYQNKKSQFDPPHQGEINHMINLNGKHWLKYEDDWRCPICLRSKKACVTKSKKNNWFFTTVNKSFFNKLDKNWCENIDICHECDKVSTLIRKEVDINKELEWTYHWFVKKEELKEVILLTTPNYSHIINNRVYNNFIPIWQERIVNQNWTYSKKINEN